MPKAQTRYICRNCGYESPKWLGKCPSCDEWGTLEETVTLSPPRSIGARAALPTSFVGHSKPQRLTDIPSPSEEGRILSGMGEFDRVLGGGIVRGALTLIGGEPGIGKSTLLTQVAGQLATRGGKTLYVSGEESATQIKLRAERLGITSCYTMRPM
jgi:DNA repair protein RadA/Sms